MSLHTYSENVLVKSSFNAALTNATQHGVSVDTQGTGAPFRRAAAVIDIVTGAVTTAQVTISESSTGTSGWTVVTGSTQPAVAQAASIPASGVAGAPYVINIDLAKRKRYLRVDVIGTGTAGQCTAQIVLFEGSYLAPTNDNTAVTV